MEVDLHISRWSNTSSICILCKPIFQYESQLLDCRLVMYVLCVCQVRLWDASTYIPEQQKLLVKNQNLQQLECAKHLCLLHHLSNNRINEIDKKMVICIAIGRSQIKIMHFIPPTNYPLNTYVYRNTYQLSSLRTYQELVTSSLLVIKGQNINCFERLWKPSFVPTLEYNHQYKVTWYFVSTSPIVLKTSNSCKVFVLKLQPQYICCRVILIIASYPNHCWVVKSLDCVSQQSTTCIVYNLLSRPWDEIMVLF